MAASRRSRCSAIAVDTRSLTSGVRMRRHQPVAVDRRRARWRPRRTARRRRRRRPGRAGRLGGARRRRCRGVRLGRCHGAPPSGPARPCRPRCRTRRSSRAARRGSRTAWPPVGGAVGGLPQRGDHVLGGRRASPRAAVRGRGRRVACVGSPRHPDELVGQRLGVRGPFGGHRGQRRRSLRRLAPAAASLASGCRRGRGRVASSARRHPAAAATAACRAGRRRAPPVPPPRPARVVG